MVLMLAGDVVESIARWAAAAGRLQTRLLSSEWKEAFDNTIEGHGILANTALGRCLAEAIGIQHSLDTQAALRFLQRAASPQALMAGDVPGPQPPTHWHDVIILVELNAALEGPWRAAEGPQGSTQMMSRAATRLSGSQSLTAHTALSEPAEWNPTDGWTRKAGEGVFWGGSHHVDGAAMLADGSLGWFMRATFNLGQPAPIRPEDWTEEMDAEWHEHEHEGVFCTMRIWFVHAQTLRRIHVCSVHCEDDDEFKLCFRRIQGPTSAAAAQLTVAPTVYHSCEGQVVLAAPAVGDAGEPHMQALPDELVWEYVHGLPW